MVVCKKTLCMQIYIVFATFVASLGASGLIFARVCIRWSAAGFFITVATVGIDLLSRFLVDVGDVDDEVIVAVLPHVTPKGFRGSGECSTYLISTMGI